MGDGPVVVTDVGDGAEVVEEEGPDEAFEDHVDDVIEEVEQ
ncbi:MAG TPA: hypothetical protein VHM89_03965 [Acidimicrobiales bacterium]|nr:hypothetical protein [Acidimicrobiales bacterium]